MTCFRAVWLSALATKEWRREGASNVTAVIPAFNGKETLLRAVSSVLAQSYQDYEIIIVDDGSTDGTFELAKSISDDRIKIIVQTNKGPGAARNAGLLAAQGRWIAFLDADDTWEPDFFTDALESLAVHPDILFYFGATKSPTDNQIYQSDIHPPYVFRANHKATAKTLRRQTELSLCLMLADKDTISSLGGYYEKNKCIYGEDSLLSFLIFWNHPVIRSNKIVHTYNQSTTGLSLSRHRNVQVRPMVSDSHYLYERLPEKSHISVRKYVAYLASIDAYRLAKIGDDSKGQRLIGENHVLQYTYQPTILVSLLRFYFYKAKNQCNRYFFGY
jgi:glycosyltransferase involved in cell wall biosynthesis